MAAGIQKNTPTVLFTASGFILDAQPETLTEQGQALQTAFEQDADVALYQIGLRETIPNAEPGFRYLQTVSAGFFRCLMQEPGLEIAREHVELTHTEQEVQMLLDAVPFVIGSEQIDAEWILARFSSLLKVFSQDIRSYSGTVELYFTEKNQQLRVPERVFFHLVENQRDEEFPFAFLATYATTDGGGNVRHVPLEYALTEYADDRQKLLTLLACLNRAAEVSVLIGGFVESGELFHPLRLTSEEAYSFLRQIEEIEQCGILCRIPNWWKKRAYVPALSVQMGGRKPSFLGFDALVSLVPQLSVNGVALSREEIADLLAQTEGLHLLKGKWVEVNHERLRKLLERMEELPGDARLLDILRGDIPLLQEEGEDTPALTNGQWLNSFLHRLRHPETLEEAKVPDSFHALLRPYQHTGYAWLNQMHALGFGACLADDMGLGKTVQVLCYLERLRRTEPEARVLLIVPASLVGNWQREAERFAPDMPLHVLHGRTAKILEQEVEEGLPFLTVTTYGMTARIPALAEVHWNCVILDEAQAIKNPLTRQTKAIKQLHSGMRIAMTGTPIENELGNLWSLFDYLDSGLLGTRTEFKNFCKTLDDNPTRYGKLKAMVSPFLLRRLKTDRRIIQDLPEKMETVDYVSMSKKQVALYRRVVADLEQSLKTATGISRKGLVLATISKLKQICNHPDQYLGQTAFEEKESGKLAMMRELCETIYEKRERVLVFTQFREITDALASYLEGVFGRKGLVLHGGVPAKRRQELVEQFQSDKYVPFMVLSVRAGGTGLNLTRANHVIHFDRWWNPAVENQATDRAFRIGQDKNVMVHKLVCSGTIEEKIDAMINEKKQLAEDVIGSGGEQWITELDNRELLSLMRLE